MQLVRPDGNPSADLMIVGDAPGSDDDRSGRAFSGATGEMVDRVLGTIGVDRQSALLATLVPWRPPGNRRLSDGEVQQCLPFMHRLLAIVRPRHLVLMGGQTVRALAGEEIPIRRLRGRWLQVQVQNEQLTIAALAFPTTDQWLTNAATKQQLWSDLVTLRIAVTTA
jgi:DNA polymerase